MCMCVCVFCTQGNEIDQNGETKSGKKKKKKRQTKESVSDFYFLFFIIF